MSDWHRLPDEELARRGRDMVRRGNYALGNELLSEYCSRRISQERPIAANVVAAHGLAVGMTGNSREGLEICQRALAIDRRNPDIWIAIARLSLVSGNRKKAIEAVARGLALAPQRRELVELRRSLGTRRRSLLPFLPRNNPFNVFLGRVVHRLLGPRKGVRTA